MSSNTRISGRKSEEKWLVLAILNSSIYPRMSIKEKHEIGNISTVQSAYVYGSNHVLPYFLALHRRDHFIFACS